MSKGALPVAAKAKEISPPAAKGDDAKVTEPQTVQDILAKALQIYMGSVLQDLASAAKYGSNASLTKRMRDPPPRTRISSKRVRVEPFREEVTTTEQRLMLEAR